MSSVSEEDLLRMSISGLSPPSPAFDEEKNLGNKAFKEGRHAEAIQHYNAAENINPLSPVPPANRAMAYLKLRNWQAAKADAAIALEIYNSVPQPDSNKSLPVKILLRRATANLELMLYALAAEDYASVLKLDPQNAVAKERLEHLKTNYSVTPPDRNAGRGSTGGMGSPHKKIELISTQNATNGVAYHASHFEMEAIPPRGAQDETALMELPREKIAALMSRWSGVPPSSSVEFERTWKSLKGDKLARAQYLMGTVGARRLREGLLGENLTPQLLEEIINVLIESVRSDGGCSGVVAKVLQALTSVSRFSMLLMFWSDAERENIRELVQKIESNGVDGGRVDALREAYC